MSQQELAEAIGWVGENDGNKIGNLESGRTDIKIVHLEMLAPVFGLTVPEMVSMAYAQNPADLTLEQLAELNPREMVNRVMSALEEDPQKQQNYLKATLESALEALEKSGQP